MSNEELLENLKTKYETILNEDANISKEIEALSKEISELSSNDKIKELEEIEFILKNGKSFKGKLKSFFALPYDGGPFKAFRKIIICAVFLCGLAFINGLTFITSIHHSIYAIIVYILEAIVTITALAFPIMDIVYINKVNKKYNLEDISSKLENSKKRKEEIEKELDLQEKLHQTKQIKLSELQTTMQNIMEVINISSPVDNFDLTNEQVIDSKAKDEGKKLILEKK